MKITDFGLCECTIGGGAVMVHRPASYCVWGEGGARAPTFDPHTIKRMQVPLSPYSPISVLLRQPLSIKRAMQERYMDKQVKFKMFKINEFTKYTTFN